MAAIRRSVASLPANQGKAVLLRVMSDEPYHSIGRILGCSETTARSHVSKGKARLRAVLTELGIL